MECSLPVSSVHGILQPRILAWIAMYVLTVSGTSFPHLLKSSHSLIVHGSNNPPSLLWSLFCAPWLEKNKTKQTYTAMWSDSFTVLLSLCQLGPQHCLACLIQFQQYPLQIFAFLKYDSIQSQGNSILFNVCFPQIDYKLHEIRDNVHDYIFIVFRMSDT